MRNSYALFFLCSLLLAACRLDPPVYPQAILTKTEESFQPSSQGNVWVYTLDYGSHTSEETVTATGSTSLIAGNSYGVYTSKTNNTENAKQYFLQHNGLYSVRKKLDLFTDYIEFYYLKDDAVLNESWIKPVNETGELDGATARTKTTLVDKNINFPVSGKTYENTFHIHVDIEYKLDGEFLPVFSFEFYVVKGVGIVQMNSSIINYDSYSYLKSYTGK